MECNKANTRTFEVAGESGDKEKRLKITPSTCLASGGAIILTIYNPSIDEALDIQLGMVDVEAMIEVFEGKKDLWLTKEESRLDDPDGEPDTAMKFKVYHEIDMVGLCFYKTYYTLELTEQGKGITSTQKITIHELKARTLARGLSSVMGTLMFGV